MPLTVDCVCPDAEGVMSCELVSLTFVVSQGYNNVSVGHFRFTGGPTDYDWLEDWGPRRLELTPLADWVDAWNDLRVDFSVMRTGLSAVIETSRAEFYIEALYTCRDTDGNSTTQTVRARNSESVEDGCYAGVTLHAYGSLTRGVVNGAIFKTAPLDLCTGWSVGGGAFTPLIPNRQVIDVSGSLSAICFCVSGGAPPYSYDITTGKLPPGQKIDQATGCITGEPTGFDLGTPEITVEVSDNAGDTALVTCLYVRCVSTDNFSNVMY